MRILLGHNFYQRPGGEDIVFRAEKDLLRKQGHDVIEFIDHNRRADEINQFSIFVQTVWSDYSRRRLQQAIRNHRPDIAHFHNTFFLISPSVYYACKEESVPVVQTLHNYRLLCPTATFFREGRVCEDCLGKAIPWPGIQHGCLRGSRVQTAVVSAMLVFHRMRKTWQENVNIYIALSNFAKNMFIGGGLPANKIVVKPNFIYPDPGTRLEPGNYVIAVSRLSPEKGLLNLLRAWKLLKSRAILKIIGDGPQKNVLERFIVSNNLDNVELSGQLSHQEVLDRIKGAKFMVFPSVCYETFSLVVAESLACGVPVITPDFGSAAEIIDNEVTGLTFSPNNFENLAICLDRAMRSPAKLVEMGLNARMKYEQKYTAERNYQQLLDIYDAARVS